ncbi:MAG: PD-(D/E)XK nuclease family protein, partial [Firmicutes bacterium]|nr:PD-(D/E)XK nuclease family protein [Bacillota bacterium]
GTDYSGKAEPTPEDAEKSYKSNFKLEGILNDDVTLVEQMDTGLAGVSAKGESAKSEILPVSFVKKDGCYKTTSGSVALTELEFDELCQLTKENVTKLCNGISAGNIDVKPKRESKASGRDGRRSACSFCNYKSICMFDTGLGCRYEDV